MSNLVGKTLIGIQLFNVAFLFFGMWTSHKYKVLPGEFIKRWRKNELAYLSLKEGDLVIWCNGLHKVEYNYTMLEQVRITNGELSWNAFYKELKLFPDKNMTRLLYKD